jgi:hypothetical protein
MSSDKQRRALVKLLRATSDLAARGDMKAAETLWLAFEGVARSPRYADGSKRATASVQLRSAPRGPNAFRTST